MQRKWNHLEQDVLLELESEKNSVFWNGFPLLKLYFTFHVHLMKMETSSADIDRTKGFQLFSDLYAQTISYGLFVARWMSKDTELPFMRKNIRSLLPSTSDFIKKYL